MARLTTNVPEEPADALALVALIHRLAAVDRFARERVARLLCIRENQAAALLGIADGRTVTLDELAAAFEMSAGGARAFAHWLQVEAIVHPEPVGAHEPPIALRLAPGAANELTAALAPITDRLEPIAAQTSAALAAIVDALEESR
jgi:hypothetical protein